MESRHTLIAMAQPHTAPRVAAVCRDPAKWARIAILNTARVGQFSSDRTIREKAHGIWRLQPLKA